PSTGDPAFFQASSPPSKAAALLNPFEFSVSTAPALVCSAGQVQYVTIILSFGSSLVLAATSPAGIKMAPLMWLSLNAGSVRVSTTRIFPFSQRSCISVAVMRRALSDGAGDVAGVAELCDFTDSLELHAAKSNMLRTKNAEIVKTRRIRFPFFNSP